MGKLRQLLVKELEQGQALELAQQPVPQWMDNRGHFGTNSRAMDKMSLGKNI
jgi:hypothetical protein